MWPVTSLSTAFYAALAMLGVAFLAARLVQPAWWSSRAFRRGFCVLSAAMFVGLGLWALGNAVGRFDLVTKGCAITYLGLLSMLPAAAMMPFSAGLDRALLGRAAAPVAAAPAPAPAPVEAPARAAKLSRRALIRFGTSSLPAMAAVTAGSGFVLAKHEPTMPVVRMRFPGLHPDLEGLRILHLSDLHLGVEIGLDDLDRALARAVRAHRPDLIVLTGDLADDPSLIAGALERVASAGARHGAFASLGNHEYLHGIELARPAYEASRVPLLVGAGRTLRVGRARLFVAGADDPVHIGGDIARMVRPSIEQAALAAPADADFRLLLCHRPEGFWPASELGFDLTLSGHTHGGQIGLLGRSLLEKISPGVPWWGPYATASEDGRPRRLYTTSGFGHWFPFRLGCPTEMPLLVLEGGPSPRPPTA